MSSDHLTDHEIDQYVISDADREVRPQIEAHLAVCAECRARERALRSLVTRSRQAPAPRVSSHLLDRIHTSLTRDTVVVLPVRVVGPSRSVARWTAIAAAVLVTCIGGLVFARGRQLVAASTTGSLRFSPATPVRGAVIKVTYTPSPMLDRERSVHLRARYRTAQASAIVDRFTQRLVATLERQPDGTFTGQFTLPDSVAYGVFAVEDTTGRVVDSDMRRLWELLVYGSDGKKPLLAALYQREGERHEDQSSWADAYETARQAVTLYPDSVAAWRALRFYQSLVEPEGSDPIAHVRLRARCSHGSMCDCLAHRSYRRATWVR